jgi:hypothetical protein
MNTPIDILTIAEDLPSSESLVQTQGSSKPKHPLKKEPKGSSASSPLASAKERLIHTLGLEAEELDAWCATQSMPVETMIELFKAATRYGLSPILGEIAYEANTDQSYSIYIPIDSWITLIQRQSTFAGMTFSQSEETKEGIPVWMECTLYRSDFAVPMTVREYLSEVRTDHAIWDQMPRRMLRNKTLQQCARLAFGIHGPQWREDEPPQRITRLMSEKIVKSQTISTKENLRNRLILKS